MARFCCWNGIRILLWVYCRREVVGGEFWVGFTRGHKGIVGQAARSIALFTTNGALCARFTNYWITQEPRRSTMRQPAGTSEEPRV